MIRRGEVWVGNLNPRRGNEVGKIRPVLVMQADELTRAGADTVVVLPLTTRGRPDMSLFRIRIPARDRLLADSYVAIEKPRALDPSRLGEGPLTTLDQDEMSSVERSLTAALGML